MRAMRSVARRSWRCTPEIVLANIVAAVLLLGLDAASASAVSVHNFTGSFGSATSTVVDPFPLGAPTAVAVDNSSGPSSGDTYVTDPTHFRVEKFDREGHFVLMFGKEVDETTSGDVCTAASGDVCKSGVQGIAGSGQFSAATFIAVDSSAGPSKGDVYVGDTDTETVYKFDETGKFLSANAGLEAELGPFGPLAGIAVDLSGNLWVEGVTVTGIFEFAQDGKFIQNFQIGGKSFPAGLTVDAEDNLYLVTNLEAVERFNSTGEERLRVTHSVGLEEGKQATGLALDPLTNDIYVDVGDAIEHIAPSCCAITETFGSEQLVGGAGLGIDTANGTVYAADQTTGTVDTFAITMEVTTSSPTNVGTTTATVTGVVNPKGSQIEECAFEYGIGEEFDQRTLCAETVGSGTEDVNVHADLTGLQGGSEYHFRLVARNASGVAVGEPRQQFTTEPLATVDSTAVKNLSPSSADLTATVNPHGLDTTYHFEWGTSTEYGNIVPVPDEDIGEGFAARPVSQHIEGLTADTLYHWRVVATDPNGTVVSSDHTFFYDTVGEGLPDGRQLELVTPAHKNGALIGALFSNNIPPQISEDGRRVIAPSIQCFADAQSCVASRQAEGEPYEFVRTSDGWVTHPMAPSAVQFPTNSAWEMSADAGTALFSMPSPPNGQDDFYAREPDGSFVDIGPIGAGSTSYGALNEVILATSDLSHVVYGTGNPVWPFDGGTFASAYEYVGKGNSSPRLIGVRDGAGNTELISSCETVVGGPRGPRKNYNVLSEDGRTIYFTAAPCGESPSTYELYARIDGTHTVLASGRDAAECVTSACSKSHPADAAFEGASRDGSRVFFTDTQQLTDTASEDNHGGDTAFVKGCAKTASGTSGCNLYAFICATPCSNPSEEGHQIAVSAGDTSGGGPRVQGVMAISSSGSHVYFVAKGVLTGANVRGQGPQNGGENLYVYENEGDKASEGHTTFIATLRPSDEDEWVNGIGVANVTPEGRFLVFTSHRGLTADHTNREGPAQVYRYDANTQDLVRISIGDHGFNDNGNSGVGDASIVSAATSIIQRNGSPRPDPTMSDDGSYVFFQSSVKLTPAALDDVQAGVDGEGNPLYAQNIYEYHAGRVSLISDGRDTSEASKINPSSVELLGSDRSGTNVFFTTVNQLTPRDTDTQRDYYDAHICSSEDPCSDQGVVGSSPCSEEGCHSAGPRSVGVPAAASIVAEGMGNLPPSALVTVGDVKILQRAFRGVRGGFSLRLKVPSKGRVRVSGGKIFPASKAISAAGTYRVNIRLTARAQAMLRHRHTLKLELRIAYTSPSGSKPVVAKVTLRR